METTQTTKQHRDRISPLEIGPDEFRRLGHRVIDQIADFLISLPDRPVAPGESPDVVRKALGNKPLPLRGDDPERLLDETVDLLFKHSLFNGHPRFWGYIMGSAAPIGALGDLLAAAVNPNLGGWPISPIASEIEAQTVRWIAEMIGYPTDCGGLLVSGGNMANFVGFWVARRVKSKWDVRSSGISGRDMRNLKVYTSRETHTWIEKATDLSGLGTNAIRWIPTDKQLRMDTTALRTQIREDTKRGDLPFLLVGSAGTVSTGAIDPLPELADICRERDLWFHVDGAYGGAAAILPDASPDLKGLSKADSVAIDPHKWLYAPLEAGCVLVRDSNMLRDTFFYHPPYYPEDDQTGEESWLMYHEYGPQNSRGFRALKVWLGLRQVGREGYIGMISDDIKLARGLYDLVKSERELQAFTQGLSITTFRYIPPDLKTETGEVETYLSALNKELLARLQNSGEAYVTNAVIGGKFVLRACVVNFRTTIKDIEALPGIVIRIGREVDAEMRPAELRESS
jgi:aromatic-L-amino-acid/L-tryptophan decarboxylase